MVLRSRTDEVAAVASTIVSQGEGPVVALADVLVSQRAATLAVSIGRDARVCQPYPNESRPVLEIKVRHVGAVDRRGF